MSMKAYLGTLVAVTVLGVAMVVGTVRLADHLDRQPWTNAVLVTTDPVTACAPQAEWADSLKLVRLSDGDTPEGSLTNLSFMSAWVPKRPIPAGTVIRAQLLTKAKDCKTDSE